MVLDLISCLQTDRQALGGTVTLKALWGLQMGQESEKRVL
jgi:hypothetical protein